MMGRSVRGFVVVVTFAVTGCQSFYAVPVRDGAFPPSAVRPGERVRIETESGEVFTFEVASIDTAGAMTADTGRTVANRGLESVQVERLNKRKTFTTLGVIGGIIGTALILDAAEELEDCLEFDDLDDCVE